MPKLTSATRADRDAVQSAIDHLKAARTLLKRAGAPRAAEAVRKALASAEGAGRHVDHRLRRSQAMSRYELNPKPSSSAIKIVVGWDRPLQTFFAQVFMPTEDEPEEGEATLWQGTEPGELPTPEAAIALVAEHAEIPADLTERLAADMRAAIGVKDGAHQRRAKLSLFGAPH